MAKDVEIKIEGSTNIPEPSRWTSSPQDLIEFAWLIIAGAMNVGNPPVDPIPGWHEAARTWRDLYHEHLFETISKPTNMAMTLPIHVWTSVQGTQIQLRTKDDLLWIRPEPATGGNNGLDG